MASRQPFATQLLDLTLIQLTNWRWSWRGMLISGVIAPVIGITALSAVATDRSAETLGYIVTGNLVLSMMFGTVNRVAGNFTYMRTQGMLDYFATLPLYRAGIIMASVTAFFLLSLPQTLITLLLGTAILNLPLRISPLIVVVLPLVAVSLSGLGALIGLLSRTLDEVTTYSQLATFGMLALGPVILPADRLPPVLQAAGLFSPASHAAGALRRTLLNTVEAVPLWEHLGALLAITVVLLWVVSVKLDWRQR